MQSKISIINYQKAYTQMCFRISIIFLFFIAGIQPIQAQIISNKDASLYKGPSVFNTNFIKDNSIVKITGTIAVKKTMKPIEETGEIVQYIFNTDGLLIETVRTSFNKMGDLDTNGVLFYYDDINQLINEVYTNKSGFNATKYEYDQAGNINAVAQWKGENLSSNKYELKKGKPFKLSEEKYEWIMIDDSTRFCIYYNADGIPYKEGTTKYNAFKQVVSERHRLLISNKNIVWNYSYDDTGKLLKVENTSTVGGNFNSKSEFTYDEMGAVYEEKIYRNGILEKRRQFVYDPNTALLKAELLKNEQNGQIEIIQYTFNFGETTLSK